MSKKENQEKFEAFKVEVLKWRNEHLLECKMFEKSMYENDGEPLLKVYLELSKLLPSMAKKWETLSLQPSTYDLNHLDELVEGSRFAKKLINDFKFDASPKAGILLSWIFYGDFFEVIVYINEKFAKDEKKLNLFQRYFCAIVAKIAVKSSIKSGYRTKEQWNDYYHTREMLKNGDVLGWIMADLNKDIESEKEALKVEKQRLAHEQAEAKNKEQSELPTPDVAPSDLEPKEKDATEEYPPFSNLLRCPLEKKDALVNAIGEHIQETHTGWDFAYLNKALVIRGLLNKEDASNATLYRNSLILQYPKLEPIIPSLRTIQTYMSKLRSTTMGVGQKDMFERVEFKVELDKAFAVIDRTLL